jgi:hypothetical protein
VTRISLTKYTRLSFLKAITTASGSLATSCSSVGLASGSEGRPTKYRTGFLSCVIGAGHAALTGPARGGLTVRALVPDTGASAIGRIPASSRASADATPLLFKKHLLQPAANRGQTASVLIEPEVSPGHNMRVVLDAVLAEHPHEFRAEFRSEHPLKRYPVRDRALTPFQKSAQSQTRIRVEARSANQVLCDGLLFRA